MAEDILFQHTEILELCFGITIRLIIYNGSGILMKNAFFDNLKPFVEVGKYHTPVKMFHVRYGV